LSLAYTLAVEQLWYTMYKGVCLNTKGQKRKGKKMEQAVIRLNVGHHSERCILCPMAKMQRVHKNNDPEERTVGWLDSAGMYHLPRKVVLPGAETYNFFYSKASKV